MRDAYHCKNLISVTYSGLLQGQSVDLLSRIIPQSFGDTNFLSKFYSRKVSFAEKVILCELFLWQERSEVDGKRMPELDINKISRRCSASVTRLCGVRCIFHRLVKVLSKCKRVTMSPMTCLECLFLFLKSDVAL